VLRRPLEPKVRLAGTVAFQHSTAYRFRPGASDRSANDGCEGYALSTAPIWQITYHAGAVAVLRRAPAAQAASTPRPARGPMGRLPTLVVAWMTSPAVIGAICDYQPKQSATPATKNSLGPKIAHLLTLHPHTIARRYRDRRPSP
jgi:hypothetical protein